ncbi:MAG TPA: winged helix-turn-helix domain-containing protein [Candidatus Acidoferrales bacterium]|nr:winged helix-turn-helix domain-containing protein [Candidatus Acidoferrales bacterium]
MPTSPNLRFGPFELDVVAGELRKAGILIKLQPQPFRVLLLLANRAGTVVTREDIKRDLWSDSTFVDFDHGINFAINQIRAALADSADSPRFIETLPRRGYRFIAQVEYELCPAEDSIVRVVSAPVEIVSAPPGRPRLMRTAAATAGALVVLLAGLLLYRWLSPLPPPRVLRTIQLTHYSHLDGWSELVSDGARVFFLAKEGDHWNLMQVPVSGGESQPFPSPFQNTRILDLSPDHSEFLVQSFTAPGSNLEFWTLPVVGGSPRRLGDMTGRDGTFSPDGRNIAYGKVDGIYMCTRSGNDAHRIVSLPDVSWGLAWSPDGKTLRFTLDDQKIAKASLWEVSLDGTNLHPLLPGWNHTSNECCGQWSVDGRYYFFLSTQGDGPFGNFSVWARRERRSSALWSTPGAPVHLAAGPMNFGSFIPTKDGRRLLISGFTDDQSDLLALAPDKKAFLPMLNIPVVYKASLAPKGDWLALILPGWTLWRSRKDGSERTQLAADFPGGIDSPRWSPDGSRIVFEGRSQDRPWNIYLVNANGGSSQELLPNDELHQFPDWLPDGGSIVYSTPRAGGGSGPDNSGIFVLNLETRKTTKLPGSEGLRNPRSLSGSQYLAALSEDQKKVMLFDFQTHEWRGIASGGKSFYYLESSQDGKDLYFQDSLEAGQPLYRVHAGDWKLQRVMSFESLLENGVLRCRFAGLTPDGSPMVLATRGGGDIYQLDLDLP